MIKFQTKKFTSGLRYISTPLSNTKAVTALVLAGIGSRFEKNSQAGVSHFLEHMLFKGSKKYPHYRKIARTLDGLGAQFNAFTGTEYTGYYIRSSSDHFPQIIDILADIYLHPVFPPIELEKERGVIVEEINMYHDQPMEYISELFEELTLGGSVGRAVIGNKQTVANLKRKQLVNYHKRMYQPTNTIVVVAGAPGAGGEKSWRELVEQNFDKEDAFSFATPIVPQFLPWQPPETKSKVLLKKRDIDQAHFVLGLPALPMTDSRQPRLKLLVNILGGMMSSRLFEEIREKRGLAYYVNAGESAFYDAGLFYVRAGVKLSRVKDVIGLVQDELMKVTQKGVLASELHRAKENIKGSIYLGLEDSHSIASFLAMRLLYWKKIKQPEQIIEELESVTTQEIQKTANYLWGRGGFRLALIGPYQNSEEFVKLLV